MAFGFNRKQSNVGKGQNPVLSTVIAVMAALVVFQLGKMLGTLAVQLFLPIFYPDLVNGSEAVVEELLQQEKMGVPLSDYLNAVVSLAMQIGGGMLCWMIWKDQIRWTGKKGYAEVQNDGTPNLPDGLKKAAFLAMAVFGCLGMNLLMNGFQLTMLSQTFMEAAEQQASVPTELGILMYALVAPMAEEILFRGIAYNRIRKVCDASKAIPFAAVFFAVYHGNIIQGVYAGILGALLCFIYEKTDSLWTAILFHGVGNLAVYLIIDVFGIMNTLGNLWSIILGIGLVGLAVGSFFLCFGKDPSLD